MTYPNTFAVSLSPLSTKPSSPTQRPDPPSTCQAMPPQTWQCDFHSEFVQGLDFNLFMPDQIATCSWDRRVCLWRIPPGLA